MIRLIAESPDAAGCIQELSLCLACQGRTLFVTKPHEYWGPPFLSHI